MKKYILTLLTILALTLTACGASATETATSTSEPAAATLPASTTLLLGTLKLNGTAQDVTAEQAAQLLPLWQVYSGLISSNTAAQAEVDALLDQIKAAMTDEQLKAIDAMQLTQQDVFAVMQEQGLSMSLPNASSDSGSSGSQNTANMGPPDGGGGGMPMGAPPDGGGGEMPMGDAMGSNSGSNTNSSPSAMDPSLMLIQALIESLQAKIAS